MILCTLYLRFDLIDVHSLKGRRSIVNAIKERLKKYNISILDISGEYPKEAQLAIAFFSHDGASAEQTRRKIMEMLDSRFPEWPYEMEYEEL